MADGCDGWMDGWGGWLDASVHGWIGWMNERNGWMDDVPGFPFQFLWGLMLDPTFHFRGFAISSLTQI